MSKKLHESTRHVLRAAQQNDISKYQIYRHLARAEKNARNAQVLQQIAEDARALNGGKGLS